MLRSAYITGIRLSLKLSIRWPYAILPKGFGEFDKTGNARMKTWSPPLACDPLRVQPNIRNTRQSVNAWARIDLCICLYVPRGPIFDLKNTKKKGT